MEVMPIVGVDDVKAAMLENTSGEPLPKLKNVTPATLGGISYFSTMV